MEKNLDTIRTTLKMPVYVKDFFLEEAKKYGLAYSNYMVMILIQYIEKSEQAEMLKSLNDTMKELKSMSDGSMSSQEMIKDMKNIMSDIDKMNK